jgi:hypothetical protein
MGKEQVSYGILFFLSLFLIIIGIQGNLGVTIAILFTPSEVTINEN